MSIAKSEAQSGCAQGIATAAAQVVVLWTVSNGRDCLKLTDDVWYLIVNSAVK